MSEAQRQREQRLKLQDDHIGAALLESEASGELRSAPSWGRPLQFGDGYDQTPAEMRMAMKILKDAGVAPPEVLWLREAAALEAEIAACADDAERHALQRRLADKRQVIALRLERLRVTGSL